MPTKHFTMSDRIIGYGTPEAPIWFVGIEPGGASYKSIEEATSDIEQTEHDNPNGYWSMPLCKIIKESSWNVETKTRGTKIYDFMSYVVGRGKSDITNLVAEEKCGTNTYFQMNLLPLHRSMTKSKWPSFYPALYGYDTCNAYMMDIWSSHCVTAPNQRFQRMRKFWDEHSPRIAVCFGKTVWNHFVDLFDIPEDLVDTHGSRRNIFDKKLDVLYSPSRRVFLTKFFGTRGAGKPKRLSPLVAFATIQGLL